MRLENKIAVISAGASGMGRAGALLFAKEGAYVNILDLDQDNGEKVVTEIRRAGGKASFLYTNMTDITSIKESIERVKEEHGQIDILWNHVGTPGPTGIEEVNEKDFDFTLNLNLKSVFFTSKYVVPLMKETGSIIFTSSISGLVGSPFSPVYSAAKGAIINLVRSLSLHLGSKNIRVNSICPGLTETPMMNQFLKRDEDDDIKENAQLLLNRIALGRFGNTQDMANAVLFLASDDSIYITGVNLPVDGGYTA